ncbi:MAG: septum formation protein Maf [Ruminococcaceae bacterium]|nr:septum formation protein Maf [Oscillospiraceae bacterium]
MKIILASKSPRRREILQNLGVKFDVVISETDESSDINDPCELVEELAFRKAMAVFADINNKRVQADILVIGCDTVVCCDGKILGKPKDKADAFRMIKMLQGRAHEVISGVALIYNNQVLVRHEVTKVFFDALTDSRIESYISTDEPYDKAGGYAVQGIASRFIGRLEGCYFNVVGLPVNLLCRMADKLNLDMFN